MSEEDILYYPCPCCGYLTLTALGDFEICGVCWWEDDGQTDADADEVYGGPNKDLSLTQARENFKRIGAYHESALGHVRPPRPDETPIH